MSLGLLALAAGCAGPRDAAPEPRVTQREVEIRLDLAEAYLRNNEPRLALQELNLVKAQAQNLPRFHFTLGYTRLMLGNEAEAVTALQRTVELAPDHGEAWNNLGLALLAVNQSEAAELAFAAALDIPTYRTPEVAALNLAQLHLDHGRQDLALRFAIMAMELNWRFSRAYLLAAEIKLARGQTDQAISLLRRGAEANLDDPRLLLALVEYLFLAGRSEQALPWLEKLHSTAPEGPEARRAEEYRDFFGEWQAAFLGQHGLIFEQDIQEVLPEKTAPPPDPAGSRLELAPVHPPIHPPVDPPVKPGPKPDEQQPHGQVSLPPPFGLPSDGEAPLSDHDLSGLPAADVQTFIVQVGAFLDNQRGLDLRDALRARGFPAETVVIAHMGKDWTLVFVASAPSRDEARALAENYRRLEDREALVVGIRQGRYMD